MSESVDQQNKPVVLFLCTANAARSQMAEALLRDEAGDRFAVYSAGLDPRPIHPLTVRVLAEIGIDISQAESKDLKQFLGRSTIRHAIIVCEKAQQRCPSVYPFSLENLYWPFEDPAACVGSEKECLAKFREVRDAIRERIHQWLSEEQS